MACSVGKKGWEVHPGVVMLEGRVLGDEERDIRVVVVVREGELILYDEWVCEWKEGAEERRQWGGVLIVFQGRLYMFQLLLGYPGVFFG